MKGYWDEIKALKPSVKCICGATKEWELQLEKTRLKQFLKGLHSNYTIARGHLLMMFPWPTVNEAFMLFKQEEKQRQFHKFTSSPVAMMVNVSKPPYVPTSYNPNKFSEPHPVQECAHCHVKGYTKERC